MHVPQINISILNDLLSAGWGEKRDKEEGGTRRKGGRGGRRDEEEEGGGRRDERNKGRGE